MSDNPIKNKPKLTDEEFVAKLRDLDSNQTHLAEFLGINRQTVIRRMKRLKKKGLMSSTEAGKVVISSAAAHAGAVQEGYADGMKQIQIMDSLMALLRPIESNIAYIVKNIEDSKKKNQRIKPFELELMVKLVREGRGLVTDTFKIKKELFNVEGVAIFMKAVVTIMERYDHDVQSKLYTELSRIGLDDQAHGFDAREDTAPK